MQWFDVDKAGLAAQLEMRGRAFAVMELVQNGFDAPGVTEVSITLEGPDGSGDARLRVTDDSTEGFLDLTHAYTLFAPSVKADDPTLRGRFNLGEKLVLALAKEAVVVSTTGSVTFSDEGRHIIPDVRRECGTEVEVVLPMTEDDVVEVAEAVRTLIPPPGIRLTYNGEAIPVREPVGSLKASLQTMGRGQDGSFYLTYRVTEVRLYDPLPGEKAMVYELGIPVVETGDRWHYDVLQKVPLNSDRDNVPPSFLRALRTAVANEMHGLISTEDANSDWGRTALADHRVSEGAARKLLSERFGDRAVAFDPSDLEANKLATSQGYTVVHGRSLGGKEWENAKKYQLLPPSGVVTPSPKAVMDILSDFPEMVEKKWTEGMKAAADYAQRLAFELIGVHIDVRFVNQSTVSWDASYGVMQGLTFNVGRLGYAFFDKPDLEAMDALIIHELGHHYSSDHLSSEYYHALCKLGARMRNVTSRLEVAVDA